MSFFDPVLLLPNSGVNSEKRTEVKVDFTTDAYRTEDGQPYIIPVVRQAKINYANQPFNNHDYLPILGHEGFRKAATELVLGADSSAIKDGRSFGVQCLSGTGALRSGAEFLVHVCNLNTVYLYDSTWKKHEEIFKKAGFTFINKYSYFTNNNNNGFDISSFLATLELASEKSVVVFHAHSPAGMDPSQEQWMQICEVIKRKNLFTFFDLAYQGLVSGNPATDAWAIRYFVDEGLEMFVAQSFAMNFGLYSERVGNLTVVMKNSDCLASFPSQMTLVNVSKFSNPPAFGACIVHQILTTPSLRQEWMREIEMMSASLAKRRTIFISKLQELNVPVSMDDNSHGLFIVLGLSESQLDCLENYHGVKLLENGGINVCSLNSNNLDFVTCAIQDVICPNNQHF